VDDIARRKDTPRLNSGLVVHFGTTAAIQSGIVHNMSPSGIGMFTRVVYPPGTRFQLTLVPEEGDKVQCDGEVRWTRLLANPHRVAHKYEMGVMLLAPPYHFTELFNRIWGDHERQLVAQRRGGALPVSFVEPAHTAPTVNGWVAEGGAYIFSGEKPKVGNLLFVRVHLPQLRDVVWALGRVDHVRLAAGDDPGGVAVRYLRLLAGDQVAIQADLERLDAQHNVGIARVVTAKVLQGK